MDRFKALYFSQHMTNQDWLQKHYGVTRHTWYELRRYCRQLHSLDEQHCNGEIQFDEDRQTWYRYNSDSYGTPTIKGNELRTQPEDILRAAEALIKRHGLKAFHQGDPRGCSLYVYKPEDVHGDISCRYSTEATAIC